MKFRYLTFILIFLAGCYSENASVAPDGGGGVSQGGSTARFTVVGNYLYVVDESNLYTYDISEETEITRVNTMNIDRFVVETIFPFNDMLFLGTRTGVVIVDISLPSSPTYISDYQHFVACDPVVTDGEYAYVTLREGTSCDGDINELQILDVTDILNPQLISTYPMNGPRGLALNGDVLFVCDNGIKVLDVTDPLNITELNHIENIPANDIIYYNNRILVTADNGFYQFNVFNPLDITQIGQFAF
ncbi:MAG: hypothetical protein ABFS32_09280 [Bacteroidota bacterium]